MTTRTTYRAGDRVYVPGLASHVRIEEQVTDAAYRCRDEQDGRSVLVDVTAMEAPKSDLYRHPSETTRGES